MTHKLSPVKVNKPTLLTLSTAAIGAAAVGSGNKHGLAPRCLQLDLAGEASDEQLERLRHDAWALVDSGADEEALASLQQCIALSEESYGPEHSCVARALCDMAEVLTMQVRSRESTDDAHGEAFA